MMTTHTIGHQHKSVAGIDQPGILIVPALTDISCSSSPQPRLGSHQFATAKVLDGLI